MTSLWLPSIDSSDIPDSFHPSLQHGAKKPNYDDQLRSLHIGSLNFLHTTDTHGWYLGHVNQRQYSSDWGDYISFAINLRNLTESQGGDLLLVDTGDRHDGNGLSDMTKPHGELSDLIFMKADYDLVTVGNHELYEEQVSKYEYENVVPRYGTSFISTNVEYLTDSGNWTIFGNNTHRYFETRVNHYKVLALSFMFDFNLGNDRVRVTPVSKLFREDWLNNLLMYYSTSKQVDIVVVFGHMPTTRSWTETVMLQQYLRSFFPDTVIQFFGGHSHIRDFAVYDELSTGLQSGRYCETAGFLSISNFTDLDARDDDYRDQFTQQNIHRRYIDFNLHSFMYHTHKHHIDDFETETGLQTSNLITDIANKLRLSDTWGYIPRTFYMSSANYYDKSDKKSLLRFLQDKVLVNLQPKLCKLTGPIYENTNNNSRSIIINTGSIRYDMYKGPFTRNALFTVSPFSNRWKVIPNVPRKAAAMLQGILNAGTYILGDSERPALSPLLTDAQNLHNEQVASRSLRRRSWFQLPLVQSKHHNSYGYVTRDDFGMHGDDTVHRELPEYKVPNVIQSFEGGWKGKKTPYTDVVYYDFIEPHLFWALKVACRGKSECYEPLTSNATYYNDCEKEFNVGHLLKQYVMEHWGI